MAFEFVNPTKKLEKWCASNFLLRSITLNYYKKIVKQEVSLSNSTNNSNVLCIGGGYFPCTAILFHLLTGCKVTVIDNDIDTIAYAKKRISKLGLSEFIEIVYTDGIDFSSKGFDIIHIANQVSPKDIVFNNMKENLDKDSKILVRKPKKKLSKGYKEAVINIEGKSVKQPFYSNIERTLMYVG